MLFRSVNGDVLRPLDVSQILGIPNVEGGPYDDGFACGGHAASQPTPGGIPESQPSPPVPIRQIFLNPGTWNVRKAPNMSGAVVKTVTGNTVYDYTEKSSGWYKIDGGYIGPAAVKKEM